MIKDPLLTTCMYWSALCYIVELHLLGLWALRLTGCTCWGMNRGGHMMFRGYKQDKVMETELGLLVQLAVQCLLILCLHWSLLRGERNSWESLLVFLLSLLLTQAEVEAWLGCVITVANPTLPSWTGGVFMEGLPVDWAAAANLWTELPISRQHRWELFQRTFLSRSTSSLSFLSHYLWWIIFKNRFKKLSYNFLSPCLHERAQLPEWTWSFCSKWLGK